MVAEISISNRVANAVSRGREVTVEHQVVGVTNISELAIGAPLPGAQNVIPAVDGGEERPSSFRARSVMSKCWLETSPRGVPCSRWKVVANQGRPSSFSARSAMSKNATQLCWLETSPWGVPCSRWKLVANPATEWASTGILLFLPDGRAQGERMTVGHPKPM